MNKLFTKIGVAFAGIAMSIGVGVAVGSGNKEVVPAHATEYEWVKLTSAFSVGDELIFGYENGDVKKEMTAGTGTANDWTNNALAGTYVLTVEAGNNGTGYSFKNGTNYIYWNSGNNLSTTTTKNDASSWTIKESTNGNFKLANVGTTGRVLQYNASSPKFAPYTSTQTAFQIWKKTPVQTDYVDSISIKLADEDIEEANLDVGGTKTITLTADVTVVGSPSYTVAWESNNTSVATVSSATGTSTTVTAVSMGKATITVSAEGKTDAVEIYVDDTTLSVSNLTFTKACGGTGTASDGLTWTVAAGTGSASTAESNFDNNRGIHYGTGSASVKFLTLTSATGGVDGTIKYVKVHASGNGAPTLSVTVGGNAFGTSTELDTSDGEYLFSGSASGTIVVSNEKASSSTGGLYLKSILIYYVPTTHVSSVSLSPSTISITSDDTEAKTVNITISPNTADDQYVTIAHSSGDSLVTLSAAYTTAISGAASFTVTGKKATSGTEVITVTSRDGSKTATLTITAVDATAPLLTGVTVSGTPTKPIQYPGYTFDPEGLIFTPVYDKENPSPEEVTGANIVWNPLVAGQNPTGTFTGETASVTVTVTQVTVSGDISVTEVTGTAVAEFGGAWDLSGLTLHQYYDSNKQYEKALVKGTDYSLTTSDAIVMGKTAITVSDSLSKISGSWTASASVTSKTNYVKGTSIASSTVVSGTTYGTHQYDADGDTVKDWIITFGGNNKSVGTNGNNRSSCKLGNTYSKYAGDTGVGTSAVASAFASLFAISENVARVGYTASAGSKGNNSNVYLIQSENGTTWTKSSLSSGTQGATIDTTNEYFFTLSSTVQNKYFGLLFEATNDSGDWRIDDVTINFYSTVTDEEVDDNFVTDFMKMDQYIGDNSYSEERCIENYEAARDAFNELTDSQRELFLTYSKYADAKARLLAWAAGYGESLNTTTNVFESGRNPLVAGTVSNNSITVVVVISLAGLSAIGGYFFLRKKKLK